ncbi:phosphotransferase family protein [Mycoplasmopsis gallinacea]|uniref:Phosphotransferase n=1 Tax=Mycoplasmopsis gallinacea TaxID=29556 RepID=A0A6H0V378_9BACT|nr:phosphotransferase [Mycoplasmopsis gallinacea]QIW62438.1 phosphotransferase [Mycoplasmopsis gallinacea]
MELIKKGYTNISYKDGEIFCQEKILNGFNHNVDYKLLNQFDFVPKFIKQDDKFVYWEFIENQKFAPTNENLEKIATNLKQLHSSSVKFQDNFMIKRLESFLSLIQKWGRSSELIINSFTLVKQIFASDNQNNYPIHNDLYFSNILKTDEKLYFVDWEYASMGNRLFDLALFIAATDLSDEQEEVFLNFYNVKSHEKQIYINQKFIAYFFIVTWALSKEQIPINDKYFIDKLSQHYQICK